MNEFVILKQIFHNINWVLAVIGRQAIFPFGFNVLGP